eukprot:CAMPEP_0170129268 /NCGR_PEP_ID=MMETSP0020_2-20130122/21736_1 /TAXON_ID=98059 /ORGANISM="Dinobryon sp., Strain UTEXLB2267" /LENGTH=320 /DNA_ID=CAMNT_0010363489 /DNA_START=1046 /DNA_END=2008 /DNA_ORIENTATION=+
MIPILAVATCVIVILFNVPRGIVSDDRNNDFVDIVDTLDISKDGKTPLETRSPHEDILSPFPYTLPVPNCLADMSRSAEKLSDERSRKAFSAERLYQAALTSAGSLKDTNRRRLMLQSAVDAVEAGLFSVAKSRLQNTFLPPFSPTTKKANMLSRPSSSTESFDGQQRSFYPQHSPWKSTNYVEMKSLDELSSEILEKQTFPNFNSFSSSSSSTSSSSNNVEDVGSIYLSSEEETNLESDRELLSNRQSHRMFYRRDENSLEATSTADYSPPFDVEKIELSEVSHAFTRESFNFNFSSSSDSSTSSSSISEQQSIYFTGK